MLSEKCSIEEQSIEYCGRCALRATTCHVTTEGIRLRPVLNQESYFAVPSPLLYAPELPVVNSGEELQAVREMARTPYFQSLDVVAEPHRSFEEYASLYRTSLHGGTVVPVVGWWVTVVVLGTTSLVLFTVLLFGQRYVKWIRFCKRQKKPREPTTEEIELRTVVPDLNSGSVASNVSVTEPVASARYVKHTPYE